MQSIANINEEERLSQVNKLNKITSHKYFNTSKLLHYKL